MWMVISWLWLVWSIGAWLEHYQNTNCLNGRAMTTTSYLAIRFGFRKDGASGRICSKCNRKTIETRQKLIYEIFWALRLATTIFAWVS